MSQPGLDIERGPDPQRGLRQVVELLAEQVHVGVLQFQVEGVEHFGPRHAQFHPRDAKIRTGY